jgi:uncharacterized protein (UPF0212 family)
MRYQVVHSVTSWIEADSAEQAERIAREVITEALPGVEVLEDAEITEAGA